MAAGDFIELPGLIVTVDRVLHQPHVATPPDRPHCFIYFITIHNQSETAVTIKGRKWVVTNDHGEIVAVEGDGVVGQFPCIEPGSRFSYNSFHLLDTMKATAEGSYIGVDAQGRRVLTRIPRFLMIVPEEPIRDAGK
ncbi:MAG: ApaG domain [Verrucomicrobiota bacterium]|nr:ApaG domain [Verrucomicrobiota bacterium]